MSVQTSREDKQKASKALQDLYDVLGGKRAFNRLVEGPLDQILARLMEEGWLDEDMNVLD